MVTFRETMILWSNRFAGRVSPPGSHAETETGHTGDWNWSRARGGWCISGHEEGGLADGIPGCAKERVALFGRSARAGAN